MRMKFAVVLSVLLTMLTACGSSATSDYGDEAVAEAERANSRVDDLESQLADLEGRLDELESQISSETNDRETADAELDAAISSHDHY